MKKYKKKLGWILFFLGVIFGIFGGGEFAQYYDIQGLVILIIGLSMLIIGYKLYYKEK